MSVVPPPPAPADSPAIVGRPGLLQRVLDRIEWLGNLLPHPATLFVVLCVVMVFASWLLNRIGVMVEHPVTHKLVSAENLMSADGLRQIILGLLPNFVNFAPLGPV